MLLLFLFTSYRRGGISRFVSINVCATKFLGRWALGKPAPSPPNSGPTVPLLDAARPLRLLSCVRSTTLLLRTEHNIPPIPTFPATEPHVGSPAIQFHSQRRLVGETRHEIRDYILPNIPDIVPQRTPTRIACVTASTPLSCEPSVKRPSAPHARPISSSAQTERIEWPVRNRTTTTTEIFLIDYFFTLEATDRASDKSGVQRLDEWLQCNCRL